MATDCMGFPDCGPGSANYMGTPTFTGAVLYSGSNGDFGAGSCGQGENAGVNGSGQFNWQHIPRAAFAAGSWSFSVGWNILQWSMGIKIQWVDTSNVCRGFGDDNSQWLIASAWKFGPTSGTFNLPPDLAYVTALANWGTHQIPYGCTPSGQSAFTLLLAAAPGVGPNAGVDKSCAPPTAPDLSTSTKVGPVTVVAGGSAVYTVTVLNTGNGTANNVSVTDTNTAFAGAPAITPPSVASIPSGGSATFTITAAISPSAPSTFVNTAIVSSSNHANVSVTSGVTNVAAAKPDFSTSTKVQISPPPGTAVISGGPITYRVTARNTGTAAASGVAVTENAAQLIGPVSTPATVASISPGGQAVFDIVGSIRSGYSGQFTNTATITCAGSTMTLPPALQYASRPGDTASTSTPNAPASAASNGVYGITGGTGLADQRGYTRSSGTLASVGGYVGVSQASGGLVEYPLTVTLAQLIGASTAVADPSAPARSALNGAFGVQYDIDIVQAGAGGWSPTAIMLKVEYTQSGLPMVMWLKPDATKSMAEFATTAGGTGWERRKAAHDAIVDGWYGGYGEQGDGVLGSVAGILVFDASMLPAGIVLDSVNVSVLWASSVTSAPAVGVGYNRVAGSSSTGCNQIVTCNTATTVRKPPQTVSITTAAPTYVDPPLTNHVTFVKNALELYAKPGYSKARYRVILANGYRGGLPSTGTFMDGIPAGVTRRDWQVELGSTGAFTGNPVGTGPVSSIITLDANEYVAYLIEDLLDANIDKTLLETTNTATWQYAVGMVDSASTPTPASVSASTSILQKDVRALVRKTADKKVVQAGETIRFTIEIENTGPKTNTYSVTDLMPAGIASWKWKRNACATSCLVSPGTGEGTSDINDTVHISGHDSVTYVIDAKVKDTCILVDAICNEAIVRPNVGVGPITRKVCVPIFQMPDQFDVDRDLYGSQYNGVAIYEAQCDKCFVVNINSYLEAAFPAAASSITLTHPITLGIYSNAIDAGAKTNGVSVAATGEIPKLVHAGGGTAGFSVDHTEFVTLTKGQFLRVDIGTKMQGFVIKDPANAVTVGPIVVAIS